MPDSRRFTPDDLVAVRRLSDLALSPCGRWAVLAVQEPSADGARYDTNFHRLDLQDPDAEPVALTADRRRKSSPRFRPDGLLAYLAEPDPAERRPATGPEEDTEGKDDQPPLQVHALALDGGPPRRLTDLARGVSSFRWTPSGDRLVLLAPVHPDARDLEDDARRRREERDRKSTGVTHDEVPVRAWDRVLGPAYGHVIRCGRDGEDPVDLTPGVTFETHEAEIDVAPDGRWAALDWSEPDERGARRARIALLDLEDGTRRLITSGPAHHWRPRFSPDGRRLAVLTRRPELGLTGKTDVALLELAGASHDAAGGETRATADIDLCPTSAEWIDDVRLAWSADEDGHHRVHALDVSTGADRAVTGPGCATTWRLSADRRQLLFRGDRLHEPPDLHAVDLAGGAPRRLTRLNAPRLRETPLVQGRSETFTAADGTSLQVWEVRPPDFDESRRWPLLVWIHGGPRGAYRDEFHFRWNAQVHAAAGRIVLMINPRGSTGFGQRVIEDLNGHWGDVGYGDVMAAVEEWARRPYVDDERIAALGASYGGYMVNWIAGSTDRFRCLVSHAGLFHLPAFWGATDHGPYWELEFGGSPWEAETAWERWSPHRQAPAFRTPTLVIHGEKDFRVPIGEGLQMFAALRRHGVPARLLTFPDENHWILSPPNLRQWNEEVLAWLDQHLR